MQLLKISVFKDDESWNWMVKIQSPVSDVLAIWTPHKEELGEKIKTLVVEVFSEIPENAEKLKNLWQTTKI